MTVKIALPKLFKWQQDFSESTKRHRLAVVSRQAGKTTVAKSIAIRQLLEGRRVLWVAPTFQQLTENFTAIKNTIAELTTRVNTPKQIDLLTKGVIYFRSADKPDSIRGLAAIDLCVFDEMAFSNEESYSIVRPMLSTTGGRFVLISTPNGHNFFHKYYISALDNPSDWFVARYDWTCSPLLTDTEIATAKADLTPNEFRQEYEAEFISPKGALFDPSWLKDILVDSLPTAFTRSMIGTDVSLGGLRSDLQSVVFAGWSGNVLYCDCSADRMNIEAFNRKIRWVYDKYKPEGIAYETNAFQTVAAHNLKKQWEPNPLPPIYELINTVNKETRIARLATLLSRNQLKILNNTGGIEAFNELSDFPSAKSHCDVLDAIEQAWRTMCEVR